MSKSGRQRAGISAHLVEKLETRQLLSVALDDTGSVLLIRGSIYADDYSIALNDDQLVVTENGNEFSFNRAGISVIDAALDAGRDRLQVSESFPIKLEVRGGTGADTIIGGAADDWLRGSRGRDLLIGNGGNDTLVGGIGGDRLLGGDGVDVLRGGGGANIINSGAGDDSIPNISGTSTVDKDSALLARPLSTVSYEPQAYLSSVRGYDPNQIRQAYNFGSLDDRSYTLRGEGQTIYIVDAFTGRDVAGDFATFCAMFDLPAPTAENFQIVNAGGRAPAVDAGWAGEISLDIQWARAIAPAAKIVLVQADSALSYDIVKALSIAANMSEANGGGVVSLSLGFPSHDLLPPNFASWDEIFTRSTNTTFLVAAGDDPAILSFPAFSPNVTAVGGTILYADQDGRRNGEEIAWYEDLDPASTADAPVGTGGGETFNYPTPPYQRGITVGGELLTGRGVPDVAYNASVVNGFATYISTPQDGDTGWFSVGGTSAGAPQWAALVALINQRRADMGQGVIGNRLNGVLYEAYNNGELYGASGPMQDILTGVVDSLTADEGYDLVTGLGVPNAQPLIEFAANFQPFYFQSTFEYDAALRITNPSGAIIAYDWRATRPRSGSGSIGGGDILQLEFLTVEPDFNSDPLGLSVFDYYSDNPAGFVQTPIELYRTESVRPDGTIERRIYGDGYAIIRSTDLDVTGLAYQFYLKFEGKWWVGDDGQTHFGVDFYASNEITGQKLVYDPQSGEPNLFVTVALGVLDGELANAYFDGSLHG